MKVSKIIEAALCADQIFTPSAHPMQSFGCVALAVANSLALLFFMETQSNHDWPSLFIAGYLLQPAAWAVGKVACAIPNEAIGEAAYVVGGQLVAHAGNALVIAGAAELAMEAFHSIVRYPPVTDLDYLYTGMAAAGAACCTRRILKGAWAGAKLISRFVNDHSLMPG